MRGQLIDHDTPNRVPGVLNYFESCHDDYADRQSLRVRQSPVRQTRHQRRNRDRNPTISVFSSTSSRLNV
jgi:hypothetical protein